GAGAVPVQSVCEFHQRRDLQCEWGRGAGGLRTGRTSGPKKPGETLMRKSLFLIVFLIVAMALPAISPHVMTGVHAAQADETAKKAAQARVMLDAMVKALGGDAWLHQQNRMY